MTSKGYIKRMSPDNFRIQNRGGKGIRGMSTIDDDYITDIVMTNAHRILNFFTSKGKVYRLKTYQIPDATRTSRGLAVINLLPLQQDEKITAIVPMDEFEDDGFLLMATRMGIVKKVEIAKMQNVRKNGLIAIGLKDGDELIAVKSTDGNQDVIMVSRKGQAIVFNESEVRDMGRNAGGVYGMKLRKGDEVVGMQLCLQGEYLLTVSEYGMGKRTRLSEFAVQKRGGYGNRCYKIAEKTGDLVAGMLVGEDRDILLITNEGVVIRINVKDISVIGRSTSGVKLMNVDKESGIRIAGVAKVKESAEDAEEDILT